MSDPDPSKPRHTGEVDEDGFCQDLMAVQGMSAAMIARQAGVSRFDLPILYVLCERTGSIGFLFRDADSEH